MTIGQKIPLKPTVYTKEELEIKRKLLKFKDSYVFVNTNFKRKGQPIFALAFCEGQRTIALERSNLIFKSDNKIFEIISNLVQKHYNQSHGNIGIWGNIVNYAYHHSDGKVYIFDTNGKIMKDIEVLENRASLRLKCS